MEKIATNLIFLARVKESIKSKILVKKAFNTTRNDVWSGNDDNDQSR